MVPYYILVAVPYALSLLLWGKHPENNGFSRRLTITVFFVLLIGLLAFRDVTCGTDLVRYEAKFRQAANLSWQETLQSEKDVGYAVFQKLIRTLTPDFGVFLAVVAILSLAGIGFLYGKESENAPLSLALFLTVAPFTMYFSGLRQILAMALVVPAWYCAKHKNWPGFIAVLLLTATLHRSGVVIALLYPLYRIRITRRWLWFLAPAWLAVLLFNRPILLWLLTLLGETQYELSDTGAYTILLLLLLFTAYSFIIPDESQMDPDTVALRNILVLAAFLQCFAPVHTLAMRVNYYFLLFIPILIPKIARRARYVWEPVAKLSVVIMIGFFTCWFFLQGYVGADKLNVFPYVFRFA